MARAGKISMCAAAEPLTCRSIEREMVRWWDPTRSMHPNFSGSCEGSRAAAAAVTSSRLLLKLTVMVPPSRGTAMGGLPWMRRASCAVLTTTT